MAPAGFDAESQLGSDHRRPEAVRRGGIEAWDPVAGSIAGYVSVAQVRSAPYHSTINASASNEARHLAQCDLHQLHSRDWECKLHVWDTQQRRGYLRDPERCSCCYSSEDSEYSVAPVEAFRGRILDSSVPRASRLVVVENLLPPALELLGTSLGVDPSLWTLHLGDAWEPTSRSIGANAASSFDQTPDSVSFIVRFPQFIEVSHPTAWLSREWRAECLRRASMWLQSRQILPVWDMPREAKVQCAIFEHVTVHFHKVSASSCWQGLVLFPYAFSGWQEGKLRVERPNMSPVDRTYPVVEPNVKTSITVEDSMAGAWIKGIKSNSISALPHGLLALSEQLWQEALAYWRVYLRNVAKAVELVSTSSNVSADEHTLRMHSQVRAAIVHAAMLLSDTHDSIAALEQWSSCREELGESVVDLVQVRKEFALLKSRLENLLPTLQHYIDMIVIRQQARLQETQLEESRKAIQQADTIKRLTILAFIYIPIQTASSIFGMNVRELAPNLPSVWAFVVTAVVMLLLTLTAAGYQHLDGIAHRAWHVLREHIDDFVAVVSSKLGGRDPSRQAVRREKLAGLDVQEPSWVL